MNRLSLSIVTISGTSSLLFTALVLASATAAGTGNPATLRIDGGTLTFDATTNFSAVNVHGKAKTLQARVLLRQAAGQLLIEEVTARLPISALTTGMGVRDEHMRKYIFTTSDGKQPDLQFGAANQSCDFDAAKETACAVSGQLAVRGVDKPLALTMRIRRERNGAYRATGEGTVKLSDYGIERPSQFGVKCADEVKIRLEFAGKETSESSSRLGGGD